MKGTVRGDGGPPEAAANPQGEADPAWERMRRYSAGTWDFQWRVPDTGEQIDCGFWRHRRDVGCIHEITDGPHQLLLLARALQDYRQRGAVLVLTSPFETQRNMRVWRQGGFRPVEEVVQYRSTLECEPSGSTGTLRFRRYTYDDRDAVLALERQAFPWIWWSSAAELSYYDRLMGTQFWVASEAGPDGSGGGGLVALLGMTISIGVGHIDRLAVAPECQRQGYGREVLSFGLQQFWRRGVRRVTLLTQHDNLRSQALYGSSGFAPTSWRQRLFGLWLNQAARSVVEHGRAV